MTAATRPAGRLHLTRGLPASGKTTFAARWVSEDPERRARVNRDDLRMQMFGRRVCSPAQEKQITAVQHRMVDRLLRDGWHVIVDDTNLRAATGRAWANLAAQRGVTLVVHDEFLDVPVGDCIVRDMVRPSPVGAEVIRRMHARYLAAGPPPMLVADLDRAEAAYVPDRSLPEAWLVDVDGTVAVMGDRSPYEWHKVSADTPNGPVVDLVRALARSGAAIVFLSGRDETCRAATERWLHRHVGPFHELHMRPARDNRRDSVVKVELFDKHVRHRWQVRGVIDDRQQVVDTWRAMGLTCVQVAEGDF